MWIFWQKTFGANTSALCSNKFEGNVVKSEIMSGQGLAEELDKPIIRKFGKRKLHSPFVDNIWGTNLSDMQLLDKFKKRILFLQCLSIFWENTHELFF